MFYPFVIENRQRALILRDKLPSEFFLVCEARRQGEGMVICWARKVTAMWYWKIMKKIVNKRAQSILEYTMVAAVIGAAAVAMATYVFRSVQATQQMIQKEFKSE